MKTAIALLTLSLVMALASCTSQVPRRVTQIDIQYGTVERISRVPVQSAVPAGAVAGGMLGLILSRKQSPGERAAATLGGAVLGGAATKVLEGDTRAYQYHVTLNDGGKTAFVTEKDILIRGDCVAIERGRYANIRRVDGSLCKTPRPPNEEQIEAARQCNTAKNQLLIAQTDRDIQVASQKVEVLCGYKR